MQIYLPTLLPRFRLRPNWLMFHLWNVSQYHYMAAKLSLFLSFPSRTTADNAPRYFLSAVILYIARYIHLCHRPTSYRILIRLRLKRVIGRKKRNIYLEKLGLRYCPKCKSDHPISEFPGGRGYCKSCHGEVTRAHKIKLKPTDH